MKRLGVVVLSFYMVSAAWMTTYYSWKSICRDGILTLFTQDELVLLLKGLAWPYFEWAERKEQSELNAPLPPGADFSTGVDALKRHDYRAAASIFRALAASGDALSQINLGTLYALGRGVRQDRREAVKWFRLAAEQGNYLGQYALANCYDRGEGVKRDYQMAANWYRLAAEQGDEMSQNNLGAMYMYGQGVPRDLVMAYFWLHQAAARGNEKAVRSRSKVAKEMTASEMNQAQALIHDWKPKRISK